MLDRKLIVEQPDLVKAQLARKLADDPGVDRIVALDGERRRLQRDLDAINAESKQNQQEVGRLKKEKRDAEGQIEHGKELRAKAQALEEEQRRIEAQLREIEQWLPNFAAPDLPEGGEEQGRIVRAWGEPRRFDFAPKPHWDLGVALGVLDMERGAKVAGSGWPCLRGSLAKLERALIGWFLDVHTAEHGYTEIAAPFCVNRATMFGTGQLPKLEDEMYRCTDDLFLIPTAEVPVTNLHRDEILDYRRLPVKYCAWTPCYRREAGAAGKETRGITRVHQFNKVELVKLTTPESSDDELESLLGNAETLLRRLELPYRVKKLAAGDISFSAARCYDLEVHAPGAEAWLEVSSCSTFTDFQARRANLRYRDAEKKVRFVHTLNGSGLALPRVLIGVMENYQQADGSVVIPGVLRERMAGMTVIPAEA